MSGLNIFKSNKLEILATQLAQQLKTPASMALAAEMGDVTTLNAIAQEIKTQSESCVPLSKQIIQMAEDFDLDGIQKLADELEAI